MSVTQNMPAGRLTIRDLARGDIAVVTGFSGDDEAMVRELREIGFSEEDEVEILAFGAFGRTPVSVRLNRTIIALRGGEARMIHVERRS